MTMGDFWGWLKADIKLDWEKGLSVLFVNTEKAEKILNELRLEKQPVSLSQTLGNPTLNRGVKIPLDVDRERVLTLFRENKLSERYPPRTVNNKINHWVRYHIPFPLTIKMKEFAKKILKKK
jgi:hypothetical protein